MASTTWFKVFGRSLQRRGYLLNRSVHSTSSRWLSLTQTSLKYNQPLSPDVLPRPAGMCSMMRLPVQTTTADLDACFIGVPLDIGTGYKNGTRMGPRYIRMESVILKGLNAATGAAPFESLQVADAGDVKVNQHNILTACNNIKEHFSKLECIPITMGGDHSISYPILQAMKEKHGPVALVHVDAHTDTWDTMAGDTVSHGTPFRRALEENCIIPDKTFQIGIRGTNYTMDNIQWGIDRGFRVYRAEQCWHKSLVPVMEEARRVIGEDTPCYLSFDIDSLDPAFAPGTGTQEIGGLTTIQALEVIRGCRGLNIVGCDLVEVSPPYDNNNMTSMTAAHLLFEMLCILPGVKYYPI